MTTYIRTLRTYARRWKRCTTKSIVANVLNRWVSVTWMLTISHRRSTRLLKQKNWPCLMNFRAKRRGPTRTTSNKSKRPSNGSQLRRRTSRPSTNCLKKMRTSSVSKSSQLGRNSVRSRTYLRCNASSSSSHHNLVKIPTALSRRKGLSIED